MKYAIVRDMIVTANDDGSIPLSSKVVAGGDLSLDNAMAHDLVRQANTAPDMLRMLELVQDHAGIGGAIQREIKDVIAEATGEGE